MTLRRVVVDAMSARVGGGLSYLTQQLAAIEHVAPDLDLRVLAARPNVEALRAAVCSPVDLVAAGALRPVYEQVVLPFVGPRGGVLYCPGSFAPLAPTRLPIVLALQNPNHFGEGRRAAHNATIDRRLRCRLARWSAKRADEVVVISDALRDQVRDDLPEVAARAHVVQSGAPRWPSSSARPAAFPDACAPFVLSLANDAPHKHLDLVVRAWVRAFAPVAPGNSDEGTAPLPALVMAGRWFDEGRADAVRASVPAPLRDRLVLLGAVDDRAEVKWLLEHATALVSLASLEAHPLTPAEAGSLGCPLVLSDIPAHREVAGTHATYVASGDVIGLARALGSLPGTRGRHPWEWPVSWEDNARAIVAVFEAALR